MILLTSSAVDYPSLNFFFPMFAYAVPPKEKKNNKKFMWANRAELWPLRLTSDFFHRLFLTRVTVFAETERLLVV